MHNETEAEVRAWEIERARRARDVDLAGVLLRAFEEEAGGKLVAALDGVHEGMWKVDFHLLSVAVAWASKRGLECQLSSYPSEPRRFCKVRFVAKADQ